METLSYFNHCFDDLTASLNQADAMLTIVMDIDLTEFKPETIFNYFWIISNIITAAKKICEELFHRIAVTIS